MYFRQFTTESAEKWHVMGNPTTKIKSQSSPDWASSRGRFPVLANKTYLNSCAYGALATDVTMAMQQYINDRLEKGTDWSYWVERNEAVRASVADFLHATKDEVAVTSSASAGINSIASALNFNQGRNKVVISDFEFPTNAQIWYAQELRGAIVTRVPEQNGYIPVENFEATIDEETLIVAVTQLCFYNGVRLDIPAIAEIAKRKGALLLVDGYQGLGAIAFSVQDFKPDFVVGGMLKYLLGTAGIGFLYVRDALIKSLIPTMTGWFAQSDIFAMNTSSYNPAPNARRFEMGTPPIPNCYAAEAGLKIISEYGMPAIEARIAELTSAIVHQAKSAGYTLAVPDSPERYGAMITLRTHDDNTLVAALDKQDIVTSSRLNNLRISPHFYNNFDDIDVLFRALHKQRHLLI